MANDKGLLHKIGMTQIEILKIIGICEKQGFSYGMAIAKSFGIYRKENINHSQVFTTIKRLQKRGLIKKIGEEHVSGAPPRILFGLTEKGLRTIEAYDKRQMGLLETPDKVVTLSGAPRKAKRKPRPK